MKAEIDSKGVGDDLNGEEQEYGETLNDELVGLEQRLMDIEMALQNVLIDATKEFKKKVDEINSFLKEKTTAFFQDVFEKVDEYQM